MGRPFTATDDDILDAAGKVFARRGPDGFSIAEVAADVGLSRAAIILRFKSTHALKVTWLSGMVEKFANALQALPRTPSGDNLLQLAAFIGSHVHSRHSLASFFATYSANIQNHELLELELKRGQALRAAISSMMPRVAIEHSAAVNAFSAHLTGSIMAWMALDDDNSRHYLVTRTHEWLTLAGIECNNQVLQELLTVPAAPQDKASSRNRGRGKTSRAKRPAPR